MTQLHLHTEYSLLDSIIRIDDLVSESKLRGYKAIAITDHGTVGGLQEFHKKMTKEGIKPILGCEFYHAITEQSKVNYHITLLAKNKEGYENLIKLNNAAIGCFYRKPRITNKMMKKYGKGIICMSGCIGGYLPQMVINEGKFDEDFYQKMVEAFDDFWLEVQWSGLDDQRTVMKEFIKTGHKIVATVDAHYLKKEDAFAHQVALGIATNKKLSDPKIMTFNADEYWLNDDIDVPQKFKDNTHIIADQIGEYELGFDSWDMPEVDLDPEVEYAELGFRLDDFLFGKDFSKDKIKEYRERLKYEFDVIKDNGFLSYFKMVADLCAFFDDNGKFRGWSRGSAGGSLVSYLYGITKIEPIEWGLIFERFLNPSRISPPDIDLDFKPEDKQVAIDYFREKYGEVYQIGTYGTLASKEAIKSVSRIMEYKNDLHEYVPNMAPVPTISELMEKDKSFRQQAKKHNDRFIETILRLEGLKRNYSVHASGVVISGTVPLRKNKDVISTSYDMYALEDLKFIKFDILGVINLAIIDEVCKQVGLKIEDIKYDDKKTFEWINKLNCLGVFQWESEGYKKLIKDLHPDTFDELLDLNTLYRPGCLESGMTQQYIDRKFGREKVVQLHPKLNMKTQGLPLYQEDVMFMARSLAGFTMSEADRLRKAIGKKIKKEFGPLQEMWKSGCAKNGITESEAIDLWEKIEKFARYTWNKAHSVAYTLISFWTAYLSAHHTTHFYANLLNHADSNDRRRTIIFECLNMDLKIVGPDINKSDRNVIVHDDNIMLGIESVKFVGGKTVDKIMEHRPYETIEDVKKVVNKRAFEFLDKSGSMNCFGHKQTIEDEFEAMGYSFSGSRLDKYWYAKYSQIFGEVIDVHTIVTKKGDPMAFIRVRTGNEIKSITVFPGEWARWKFANGQLGFFLSGGDKGDILKNYCGPEDFDKFVISIEKGDEYLSFNPSLGGDPNVFCGGISIATCDINEKVMKFVNENFIIDGLWIKQH